MAPSNKPFERTGRLHVASVAKGARLPLKGSVGRTLQCARRNWSLAIAERMIIMIWCSSLQLPYSEHASKANLSKRFMAPQSMG